MFKTSVGKRSRTKSTVEHITSTLIRDSHFSFLSPLPILPIMKCLDELWLASLATGDAIRRAPWLQHSSLAAAFVACVLLLVWIILERERGGQGFLQRKRWKSPSELAKGQGFLQRKRWKSPSELAEGANMGDAIPHGDRSYGYFSHKEGELWPRGSVVMSHYGFVCY